jgi:hypothetical protein
MACRARLPADHQTRTGSWNLDRWRDVLVMMQKEKGRFGSSRMMICVGMSIEGQMCCNEWWQSECDILRL